MPSLRAFNPTWWALGPFAQTVVHGGRVVRNATPYQRDFTVMRDGVGIALDWKTVDPDLPPDAPLVMVCHGLGGHSLTNSCQGVTEALARQGWRVVVYNRRGHGGSSLMAAATTSSSVTAAVTAAVTASSSSVTAAVTAVSPAGGSAPAAVEEVTGGTSRGSGSGGGGDDAKPGTAADPGPGPGLAAAAAAAVVKAFPAHVDLDDLRAVVAEVQRRYPAAPKALVGLSAGSNLVVRFQGDCAAESPFLAAVSVANGHDLKHLTKALLDRPLTDLLLVKFLKEVLYDRYHEVQALAAAAGVRLDWRRLLAARRIREFEAHLTAPLWGFQHVDDYYTANHCFQSFKDIRVPLLSLANADDPVIDEALIRHAQDAARANPHIVSVATIRGGHLGWLAGATARPWMHDVLTEFLEQAFSRAAAAAAAGEGAAAAGHVGADVSGCK